MTLPQTSSQDDAGNSQPRALDPHAFLSSFQHFVVHLTHLLAVLPESFFTAQQVAATQARMCQKRQETTGEIHLKWFGQKDLYLISLSGCFHEHSSQINNFLLLHEELHAQSK